MKKNLLKLSFVIPVLAGLGFMSSAPDNPKGNVFGNEIKSINEVKGIIVENSEHDFGTIPENGGNVTATFTIINKTDEAILITNATASCGCTVPSWTKEPIEPGQKGKITATYNPKGRPGGFDKVIKATTNTNEELTMRIKGTVETAQ